MSFFLLNLQLEVDVTPVVSKHLHESINNSHFFNGTKKKTVRARNILFHFDRTGMCKIYNIVQKVQKVQIQITVQSSMTSGVGRFC